MPICSLTLTCEAGISSDAVPVRRRRCRKITKSSTTSNSKAPPPAAAPIAADGELEAAACGVTAGVVVPVVVEVVGAVVVDTPAAVVVADVDEVVSGVFTLVLVLVDVARVGATVEVDVVIVELLSPTVVDDVDVETVDDVVVDLDDVVEDVVVVDVLVAEALVGKTLLVAVGELEEPIVVDAVVTGTHGDDELLDVYPVPQANNEHGPVVPFNGI